MMKESRTLETFIFFFFLIFLLDQHQSVIESVADSPPPQQFLFPAPFQNGKKFGGKPGYPPRRVSQHENTFIFGEFYINWVLTKSKWNREREKISKQIRHEKDCNKTMPLVLQFFFLSHSYANWPKNGSKRKIWSEMTDGTGI